MRRDAMLDGFRNALGLTMVRKPAGDPLKEIFATLAPVRDGDPVDRFAAALAEAGGEAVRCATRTEFVDWLASLTATVGPDRVVLSSDPVMARLISGAALTDRLDGVELIRVPVDEEATDADTYLRRRTAEAQIGVGTALAGLADSGAVVIASTPHESRALSLLVDIHVVVLPASRILPDLSRLTPTLQCHAGGGRTSAITIVGGPSKTADIEKVLVTGIHGPQRFIVVIITDPALVDDDITEIMPADPPA